MKKSAALRAALARMDAIPGEVIGSIVTRPDADHVHRRKAASIERWEALALKKPSWFDVDSWRAVIAIMSLPADQKIRVLRWLRDAYGAPITIHDGEPGNSGMRNRA